MIARIIYLVALLLLYTIAVRGQFGGSVGDGVDLKDTGPLRIDGIFNTIPYKGGPGNGAHSAYLQDELQIDLADRFAGGRGEGSDSELLLEFFGGIDYQRLFAGGSGDGATVLGHQVYFGLADYGALFSGGVADGASQYFHQTIFGQELAGLFNGGIGDGNDYASKHLGLNTALDQLYAGGYGDGHDMHYQSVLFPVGVCTAIGRLYVSAKQSGPQTGENWEKAFSSLAFAFNHARKCPTDEIWVAQGTYYPTSGTDRSICFLPPGGIDIYGGFSGEEATLDERDWLTYMTILSGDISTPNFPKDNSFHVIDFSDASDTTVFDGFIVEYGYADAAAPDDIGAGIYNVPSDPGQDLHIRNTTIRRCFSTLTGASIFQSGPMAQMQLSDVTLQGRSDEVEKVEIGNANQASLLLSGNIYLLR